MAKIPFTLEAWLKDKSQRVETRDGRIVHNIWPVKEPLIFNGKKAEVCALIDGEEDALVFFEGGKYIPVNPESPFDLFLVTPEEELTPFEKELVEILKCLSGRPSEQTYEDYAKEQTAELLSLAIDARAKELSKGLKQSKLDKDSIPYHLIEFMCNLYTCQNWKEIEDTAELYVTRIKAAAMKDLPKWRTIEEATTKRTDENDCVTTETMLVKGWMNPNDYRIVGPECMVNRKMRCVPVVELSKLPGFKEES